MYFYFFFARAHWRFVLRTYQLDNVITIPLRKSVNALVLEERLYFKIRASSLTRNVSVKIIVALFPIN